MAGDINTSKAQAFGHPGMTPRWTSSSKEGVGTAYSVASRVWFTLSHGILNEVYFPTIDRPQIRDLQFLITDGETFFHEERRDLIHRIETIDSGVLGYKITGEDEAKRYQIVKEVISDPHQSCVLIHTKLEGQADFINRLKIYALVSPHLEMGGMGNSAKRMVFAGKEILVAWKGGTFLAMGTNTSFARTSCGFVGASDGWQDLKSNFKMDWEFEEAAEGNLALTAEITLPQTKEFTLGLAFGDSMHAAVTTLFQSLAVEFKRHRERFIEQWNRVCCDFVDLKAKSGDNGRLYHLSRNLLLSHEDKTFAGAIIASASIPWGEAKGDEDIGGYHLVWTRDMVKSATGLLACGDVATPLRALVYLACSQNPDGGFPQNFWLNGKPYWCNIQLDEVAFPIILAWRLKDPCVRGEFDPYPMVMSAAAYLVRHGPVTHQERWEESSGFSPSTLAAVIAACLSAAAMARMRGNSVTAKFLEEYADFLESHIEDWTVTTQGTRLPGILRHYIRIHPADIHDPAPNEDPNFGLLTIPNLPPDQRNIFPATSIVDPGFLELVRYGIRRPGDPLIEDSLQVIDAVLKVDTPFGPCWRRYNHDGYGQRADGGPYLGSGQGRAWPLLTGERGHYEFAAGRNPAPYIQAIEKFASKGGMLPEQVWDKPDCPSISMRFGRPTGSAMPLIWAHSEYIKLLRSVADGRIFDLIDIVADRYWAGTGRKDLEIWMPIRQVREIHWKQTLRIQYPGKFRLHWTNDEWNSVHDDDSSPSGLNIGYFDIPILPSQKAPVRFTFYWPNQDRWEEKDYFVTVIQNVRD
jgi:glucoamylase